MCDLYNLALRRQVLRPAGTGYRYMASVAGFSTTAMKEFRYLFSADSTRNNYQVKDYSQNHLVGVDSIKANAHDD